MTFDSFSFIIFLPVVWALYWILPLRVRMWWLLLASCYFYMALVPIYILFLFFLIGIDFLFALHIERAQGKARHAYLVGSILSNIGILFVFKYFNFFNDNIAALAQFLHWQYGPAVLSLALPIGLSFHTFQSLSYVVEVYRRNYPAERHLGRYALYVMFFPQLVAGPIERPQHLLAQLQKLSARFDPPAFFSGIRLIGWGFFKKIVIADRVGVAVDYVWSNATHVPGPSIFIAAVFFSIQLYADFSGYTDIARGSARLFGVDLMHNFNQPYFSRSTAEFWRRWHISLSSWFREYVYIPLGGNRVSHARWASNILLVFLITGLWHGAGWTFVVMGLLFGIYIVTGALLMPWREKLVSILGLDHLVRTRAVLQILLTFSLVTFAWIFFRAPNLTSAIEFITQAANWHLSVAAFFEQYIVYPYAALGFGYTELRISLASIAVLFLVEYQQERAPVGPLLGRQSLFIRAFLYTSLVLALIFFGVFVSSPFIYFQF